MSDESPVESVENTPETTSEAEPAWKRKARLAAIFGDVVPETTGDDRDESSGGTSEEWLRRQVPPHHG